MSFMSNLKGLGMAMPTYTTRPSATGQTATYSQSLWMTLCVQFFITVNGLLWGAYGIYEAVIHLAHLS